MKLSICVLLMAMLAASANLAFAADQSNDDRLLLSACNALVDDNMHQTAKPCTDYIRGFLAGAMVMDANSANEQRASAAKYSAFTERAYRTRVGGTNITNRNARFMHFCLPNTASYTDVISLFKSQKKASVRTVEQLNVWLYKILIEEYPCN